MLGFIVGRFLDWHTNWLGKWIINLDRWHICRRNQATISRSFKFLPKLFSKVSSNFCDKLQEDHARRVRRGYRRCVSGIVILLMKWVQNSVKNYLPFYNCLEILDTNYTRNMISFNLPAHTTAKYIYMKNIQSTITPILKLILILYNPFRLIFGTYLFKPENSYFWLLTFWTDIIFW